MVCDEELPLRHGTILNGVVEWLGINGNKDNPFHERYLVGEFTIMLDSTGVESAPYSLTNVRLISLDFHNTFDSLVETEDRLNQLQHLKPFTGFGRRTDYEYYYYIFLAKMMS